MLAHEFPPVQVWFPGCPGFCDSVVCSGDGDREHKQILYKRGLQNSGLALKPEFGVIMQLKSGKAGYLF